MKPFLFIITLIISSTIFYACSKDSVTEPYYYSSETSWRLLDSIEGEDFNNIHLSDEVTRYIYNETKIYKMSPGNTSVIDLHTSNFRTSVITSFNNSYIVYGGTISGPKSTLNLVISNNNVLTNVFLDSANAYSIGDINIVAPGVIYAASGNKLFLYDKGLITTYSLNPEELIYKIANPGGNPYIASFGKTGDDFVYKFYGTSFHQMEHNTDGRIKFGIFTAMLKNIVGTNTNVYYSALETWKPLFTDPVPRVYYKSAGENTKYVYFLTVKEGYIDGMFWNKNKLIKDERFPFHSQTSSFINLSNMQSNNLYASQFLNGKTYIYSGQLAIGN